ncbi:MAG: hypothetical protein SFX73_13115 [Kofleriaceae bacterium]|nr:hypothetical protein [Kofleriaceae bacterium]
MLTRALLLSFLLVGACGKGAGTSEVCTKYADMEIKCGENTGEGARTTIVSFCEKARGGEKDIMSQLLVLEIKCAETTTDCTAYKSCIEKAKSETMPK